MDSRGHWHTEPATAQKFADLVETGDTGPRERPVITIGIGERVEIVSAAGERMAATFGAAERNKVTLTPSRDAPNLYLEFGSTVRLERAGGEGVRAQVWDNRDGRIILRTLPV